MYSTVNWKEAVYPFHTNRSSRRSVSNFIKNPNYIFSLSRNSCHEYSYYTTKTV